MAQFFQIISLPPGEAPTEIQEAWIGCVMPLFAMVGDRRVKGIRQGVLTRQVQPSRPGYTVRVLEALPVLERHSPAAARWWRENTPYLIQPGKLFVFDLECSRPYAADAAVAVEPENARIVVPALRRTLEIPALSPTLGGTVGADRA